MSKLAHGWSQLPMNAFAHLTRRPVKLNPNELYHQIGIRSHGLGIFHKEPVSGKDLGSKRVFWVEPEDFVVNIVFAWEGAVALVSEAERGMCASHRFPTFVVDKSMCDPQYLLRYFQSKAGIDQLKLLSPGGAGRNKTLTQRDFLKLEIPFPPLREQQAIAAILSTWDEAITLTTRLIEALKRRKQALMQLLLTGEVRSRWDVVSLSEVTHLIVSNVDKVTADDELLVRLCNYMDVYRNSRIVNSMSFMEGSVTESEFERFALQKYDVIITKDSETSEDIAQASVVAEDLENVVCGYHLAILRPIEGRIYGPFLRELLMTPDVHHQFVTRANGATRYGLTYSAISTAEIPLPLEINEQVRIAELLSASDEWIEGLSHYVNLLQAQKRGLMQQLLTGAVRVHVEQKAE